MIKVLIVDDSAVVRNIYKQLLERDPSIRVIGTASDPYIAVQKIQKEQPDVITLDIHMPRMDGLTFLRKIMSQAPMPVIVISSYTAQNAETALKALEAGAVDVLSKPNLLDEKVIQEYGVELIEKIKGAVKAKLGVKRERLSTGKAISDYSKMRFSTRSVIAMGASTGGTEALAHILRELPALMPPILIVQHMPEKFTSSFAQRLDSICALKVKEAVDGEQVTHGTVYVAPGGKHMSLAQNGIRTVIRIRDGELVNRHKPSVNVLFNSIAELKGRDALGIILTGMGDDGASGILAMHQQGAYTIAQDEESSVVFGMPHKAILTGGVSAVLPLERISHGILERYAEGVESL
jgi:two-component system, chemotaxis family, protein-glutamate methylesterase/glutaminase